MNNFLIRFYTKEYKQVIGVGIILALSTGYAFASGPGHATDWTAFKAWVLGQTSEVGVWNPYWAKLLIAPLAWLPQDIGHTILNLISYAGIWYSSGQLWSILVFAVNNHAWVGNLDGIIVWGMVLAKLSNAYVVGTGLLLISIKPQYFPIGVYYIWRCRNYRILVVPMIGLILSFIFLGNWIPDWLATLPPTPPEHINVSFFPWTLPVWLLLPFAADKERFVLAATIISVPYFNQVSLFTLFAFRWHKWAIIPLILLSWVEPIWLAPSAVIYALLITPDQKFTKVIWPIAAKKQKDRAETVHSKNPN